MSIAISIAVGTTYGLFAFGVLGTDRLKYCLASQTSYYPFDYQNQREMVDYWNMPGHENVTKKFESIILYGFISHLIFIMF